METAGQAGIVGEIIKLFSAAGAPTVFVVLFAALFRGWVRLGREVEERDRQITRTEEDRKAQVARLEQERDQWRDRYLHTVDIVERAVDVAHKSSQ